MGRLTRTGKFRLALCIVAGASALTLAALAVPYYDRGSVRAQESRLKSALFTMRQTIDEYSRDKQTAPRTLQELVSNGYLRDVPKDPMTGSNQTWRVKRERTELVVHSGWDKTSLDGTPYSDW